jgi:polyisoprenoid-binding protein YceI
MEPTEQVSGTPAATEAATAAATGAGRGVAASIRGTDGWAVPGAVLTVTDMTGRQAARADADDDGQASTGPLAPGTYTAILMAPGFVPAARTALVTGSGTADLGVIRLERSSDVPLPPPGRWAIDPVHTSITVIAKHLGIASVRVQIKRFSGVIEIAEPVQRSSVRAVMSADSVDTGSKMRDDHLRSADFLDVDAYPLIEYSGSGLTPDGDEHWTVDGTLTLHGTTRPVPLNLSYQGTGPDAWGGTRAAFHATTRLHRDLFGIRWNEALLPGIPQIANELRVILEVQAVQGDLPDMIKAIAGDLPEL